MSYAEGYIPCAECDLPIGRPGARHSCDRHKTIAAKDAEIARLRGALATYGTHLDECPLSTCQNWPRADAVCACGLDGATR
jgi:hypothetical protein